MPTVLITGASSGIGAAAARLLAEKGWTVIGASRRKPASPKERWVEMDVRDEASVHKAIEQAGPLDALVCNAGFGIFGSIEEVDLDRARAQFDTNVFGTLAPIRAVLPGMRARKHGRIVVVGSLAGRVTIPFQVHYSMTKAAMDALVAGLRIEVAPFGIDVALIEPGDIKTAFNDATDWGQPATSAYGDRIRACERVIREELEKAPGPDVVAGAILRALTDAPPSVRYPVGPASWIAPLARRLLPDRLALKMIRAHFGV